MSRMAFPIEPEGGEGQSQFLIQDPFNLRKQILPILDRRQDGRLFDWAGYGVRGGPPFRTFLTAEHVLKDHFESTAARDAAVAAALYGMGLVYGTVGLRSEYFAPIREALMWRSANPQPSPIIGPKPTPRMVADVMRFGLRCRARPRSPVRRRALLSLRLSGKRPKTGDRVMAIGYPEAHLPQDDPPEKAMQFTERMCGAAAGTITALLQGRGTTYPWPRSRSKRPG